MERWDCGPDQRVKRGAAFRQWQTPVLDSAERARILYMSSPHKPHSQGKVPAAGSLRVRAQAEIPGQRARGRMRAAHLGEPFAFRAYRGPTNRRACLSDSSRGTNDDPIELQSASHCFWGISQNFGWRAGIVVRPDFRYIMRAMVLPEVEPKIGAGTTGYIERLLQPLIDAWRGCGRFRWLSARACGGDDA